MPTIQKVALLLAVLALANAHPHPVANEEKCSCVPGAKAFESYHIHVLFYPEGDGEWVNNTHNPKFARALRNAFMEHFNITECDESPGSGGDLNTLCAFPVNEMGSGTCPGAACPFVNPNFAFFVPANRYADTVPWMMGNRGNLDFMVHPNTCGWSCAPQDHLLNSIWGGNKWPVRFIEDLKIETKWGHMVQELPNEE